MDDFATAPRSLRGMPAAPSWRTAGSGAPPRHRAKETEMKTRALAALVAVALAGSTVGPD
jgi:hypothetical protein